MQKEIKFDCPECGYPVKSEIIKTLIEPKYKARGLYLCKCPICEKEVEISGKTPGSGHNRTTRVWDKSIDSRGNDY